MMTFPECLGTIHERYTEFCSAACEYTYMCTYIAVTEKWPGPKFCKTDDDEMFPIGGKDGRD